MASGSNTRTFPTVLSSKDYLDHLSNEEQRRYMEKLQVLGTCDPYLAPAAVFEPLNTSTSLPELEFGDVFIYLVENILYRHNPGFSPRRLAQPMAQQLSGIFN